MSIVVVENGVPYGHNVRSMLWSLLRYSGVVIVKNISCMLIVKFWINLIPIDIPVELLDLIKIISCYILYKCTCTGPLLSVIKTFHYTL